MNWGLGWGFPKGGGSPLGGIDWASITDGLKLTAVDNTLDIKDTTTPANNYKGIPTPKFVSLRASVAGYTGSDGLLKVAAIQEYRLDYDPRITGGGAGYLTEIARNNAVLHCCGLHISHNITATGGAGTFVDGETVTAAGGGTGKYSLSQSATSIFAIYNGTGAFTGLLTGGTSGATRSCGAVALIWTPTNIVAVKDQTGPDGIANSASKITATAANGTITQPWTNAATNRIQTAYVKRITGSGTVEMTMDGGTTWVPITVTSAWTRAEIPMQNLANPVFGLRMAVSGDAIAVYGFQHEAGTNITFSTSVIIATTSFTTRFADIPKIAGTTFPLNTTDKQGTLYVKFMVFNDVAATNAAISLDDGATNNERVEFVKSSAKKLSTGFTAGNVSQGVFNGVNVITPFTYYKCAIGFKLNDTVAAMSNEPPFAVDTLCTMPSPACLIVGAKTVLGGSEFNGWVMEALYLPVRRSDDEVRGLAA